MMKAQHPAILSRFVGVASAGLGVLRGQSSINPEPPQSLGRARSLGGLGGQGNAQPLGQMLHLG